MLARRQCPVQSPGKCASHDLHRTNALKVPGQAAHLVPRLYPSGKVEYVPPAISILLPGYDAQVDLQRSSLRYHQRHRQE